jgi:hypothetical protein
MILVSHAGWLLVAIHGELAVTRDAKRARSRRGAGEEQEN